MGLQFGMGIFYDESSVGNVSMPLKGLYLQNNRAELLAVLCVLAQAHAADHPARARSDSDWTVTTVAWYRVTKTDSLTHFGRTTIHVAGWPHILRSGGGGVMGSSSSQHDRSKAALRQDTSEVEHPVSRLWHRSH